MLFRTRSPKGTAWLDRRQPGRGGSQGHQEGAPPSSPKALRAETYFSMKTSPRADFQDLENTFLYPFKHREDFPQIKATFTTS